MKRLIGGKWFVFAWNNLAIMLGGPFDTEGEADTCLALYTDASDPIVGR